MIQRVLERLVRLKNHLKRQDEIAAYCDEPAPTGIEVVGGDEDFDEDVDGEPLTWAEQKNIRVELRRFLTWHALRMRVPKAFEDPT